MSIQKRTTPSGQVRYIARWRLPDGGQRSKSFELRRDAKEYLAVQERAARRGEGLTREQESTTVAEIFAGWIDHRPLRETTRATYMSTLTMNLGWLKDYPARKVTTSDVTRWGQELRHGRSWLGAKDTGMAESTTRAVMAQLRNAMGWGVSEGVLSKNPVRVPSRGRTVEPDTIPTMDEIMAVIRRVRAGGATYQRWYAPKQEHRTYTHSPNRVLADMLTTAVLTGMRASEIAGLTVGDVDLDAGVVRVRKQLDRFPPHGRVELKTPASRRDIPISDALRPVLLGRTRGRGRSELVFVNGRGAPLDSGLITKPVQRAARMEGAPHVHFHALRHYFASSLITSGLPIQEVSAVLGHASPAVTLGVYTHVLEGAQTRVSAAIDSAIGCGISGGSSHLRVVG